MRALAIVGALALAVSASAGDRVVREMTPERIREAIALGEKGKVSPYTDWDVWIGRGGVDASYTTPFLRVALLAKEAHMKYSHLDPAQIPAEALEPVVEVYAPAEVNSDGAPRSVSVTAIVLMPPKAKSRDQAIMPLFSESRDETYGNAFGATTSAKGMVARFRIADWREGAEIRIVRGDFEQKARLDMEKVK